MNTARLLLIKPSYTQPSFSFSRIGSGLISYWCTVHRPPTPCKPWFTFNFSKPFVQHLLAHRPRRPCPCALSDRRPTHPMPSQPIAIRLAVTLSRHSPSCRCTPPSSPSKNGPTKASCHHPHTCTHAYWQSGRPIRTALQHSWSRVQCGFLAVRRVY